MPTVEEVNDVAPALQASRSGPRDAAVRWAVSILFTRQTGANQTQNQLRLGLFDARSEEEALGKALMAFRAGDVHPDAFSAIELVLPADRSERAKPEATTNMEGE